MVRHFIWAASFFAAITPALCQTSPRELVEMTDISGLTVSPDGRWLAYRLERPSVLTGTINVSWYLVATDASAAPTRIGDAGIASWNGTGIVDPGEARWDPNSKRLIVRALIDGAVGLWEARPEHTGLKPAVVIDSNIERFAIAADGAIIYEAGPSRTTIVRAEKFERDHGILVDSRVDLAQSQYHGAIIAGRPASERLNGDWFDREPLLAKAKRTIYIRQNTSHDRVATKAEADLLSEAQTPLPDAARAALSKAGICVDEGACPSFSAARLWSHVPLPNGSVAITTHDDFMRQSITLWDPKSGQLRKIVDAKGMLNGGHDERSLCSANIEALFCVQESAASPPQIVRVPLTGDPIQILAAPNPVPSRDDLLTEAITWKVGGSRASGWLIHPKVPGRLPLFITYYRCNGYMRGGVGDEWPLRALAAHGIAALCINSLPLPDPSAEARYNLGLKAVHAAIAHLDNRGLVDPARVGMGGLSFGSEVAMWTATHSKLLKAVSIASVQAEPAYYWFNAGIGRQFFRNNLEKYWGLGPPDTDMDDWRRLSSALNVAKISAPVLMQLPEQEARLSPELEARLTTARKGEVYIFPFAPHIKVDPRQKLAAYERNLDWFRYWLQNYIDPDQDKASQYARWSKIDNVQ